MKMLMKMVVGIVFLIFVLDFMSGMVGQSVFLGDNSVLASNGIETVFSSSGFDHQSLVYGGFDMMIDIFEKYSGQSIR